MRYFIINKVNKCTNKFNNPAIELYSLSPMYTTYLSAFKVISFEAEVEANRSYLCEYESFLPVSHIFVYKHARNIKANLT